MEKQAKECSKGKRSIEEYIKKRMCDDYLESFENVTSEEKKPLRFSHYRPEELSWEGYETPSYTAYGEDDTMEKKIFLTKNYSEDYSFIQLVDTPGYGKFGLGWKNDEIADYMAENMSSESASVFLEMKAGETAIGYSQLLLNINGNNRVFDPQHKIKLSELARLAMVNECDYVVNIKINERIDPNHCFDYTVSGTGLSKKMNKDQ